MPFFDERDYAGITDDDRVPDGLTDLTYTFEVESSLIDALELAVRIRPTLATWITCDLDDLMTEWTVPEMREDEDVYMALAVSGITIFLLLIATLDDESVDIVDEEIREIHLRVGPVEPVDSDSINWHDVVADLISVQRTRDSDLVQSTIMRLVDLVYDEDGEAIPSLALQMARYLMIMSFVVADSDEDGFSDFMIEELRKSNRRHKDEAIVPYWDPV